MNRPRLGDKNAATLKSYRPASKLEQKPGRAIRIIGATEAAAGANGLSLSGSAMDVLRSNRQQTSLEKTSPNAREIDVNSWLEKAAADRGAAQAAQAAGGIGGIFSGRTSAGMMSL
jgi:hypothetical protein